MSDHVPVAEKVESEVSAFIRLWRRNPLLAVIVFVLVLGGAGWSVYNNISLAGKVNNLNSERDAVATQLRESERENRGLREVVAPLLARAAREFPGEEINDSLKKVVSHLEASLPQNHMIASVTITAEVFCVSDEKMSTHFLDKGCFAGFGKGTVALLTAYSGDSFGHDVGERTVRYRAIAQMPADDSAVGRKVISLIDTQFIQIEFAAMPERVQVKRGKVMVVLNGLLKTEFFIPEQIADGRRVFVRNIGPALSAAIAGEK